MSSFILEIYHCLSVFQVSCT